MADALGKFEWEVRGYCTPTDVARWLAYRKLKAHYEEKEMRRAERKAKARRR